MNFPSVNYPWSCSIEEYSRLTLLANQLLMKYILSLLALFTLLLAGCRHLPTPPVDEPNDVVPETGNNEDEVLTGDVYYSSWAELVTVTSPLPGETVTSPITIAWTAPGYRFFEATAPVVLTDRDGLIIAEGYVTATEEWMTEDIIPFEGVLTYTVDPNWANSNGSLILQKSNPSGLPENNAAVEFMIQLN